MHHIFAYNIQTTRIEITVVIKVPKPLATPLKRPKSPLIKPLLGSSKISMNPWPMAVA